MLIFDARDDYGSYSFREDQPPHKIKAIYLRQVPQFTAQLVPEIVRVRPYTDDSQRMTTDDMQRALSQILKTYQNGILVAEDVNVYVSDNPTNDIMGSLATLRQSGVDLILHYQIVAKAGNPKLLGMANYIRLHKTNDSVRRHKDKFQDHVDIMMIAEGIVDRRYMWGMKNHVKDRTGEFFSCLVDLEYHKIRGIFNEKEAEVAIQNYISDNAGHTINLEMNRKDRFGKNIWKSYEDCYAYLEQKMFNEFFDFKKKGNETQT